ncbi:MULTISPECIES: coiled-coil domain-containing protein [Flavobacterium]|uniref:Coiled-coil domain-containing protein n=1 Tax=Flavobacterium jumunjinense TaxID=998845 RepID=A0ABV5GT16_9FLAO|nr:MULTISPECIES: hypothetical protein [Flavobacterium]
MKTKIVFLLIVLFTISIQAQIPTLAERSVSNKKVKENVYKDLNRITFLNEKLEDLNNENQSLKDSIKVKEQLLNNKAFTLDTLKINKLNNELNVDSSIINLNNSRVSYINELLTDIDKNNFETKYQYNTIYDDLFNKKIDSIRDIIDEKIEAIKYLDNIDMVDKEIALIQSLKKEILNLEYELKTKNTIFHWFPSIKSRYGNLFYKQFYNIKDDKTSFLNSFALNYNDLGAIVQSEIIGDTFNSFRMSFGSMLQSNVKTSETEEEKLKQTEQNQLEQLLNGGGNFYLETIYPVYYNLGNICSLYGFLSNRTAFSLKEINESIDSETFNTAFGANLYLGLNSDKNKFNLFFKGDFNYIIGTKSLYQNLQLAEEKPFLQGKLIVGVTFLSKFRLAATLNSFGSDDAVRRSKITVGLQVIP